ncbi:MAG: TonB family protein [Pseudomonadota bacterium]
MHAAPRYQHYSSGGLALLVHGLFLAALVFGVSWKNPPALPVEADLWAALPELLPPPPPPEPLVEPAPLPPPPPVVEKLPSRADIALEKARKEEAARLAAEKARLEQERKDKEKAEQARLEQDRLEKERLNREKLEQDRKEKEKKDLARRQMEQELARQMQDDLDAEGAQLRAIQERARASRQVKVINDFKHRIQAKILAYVRNPAKLTGNPEAVFQVTLLPNGEVARVTLVKSSGQPAYDSEVERAILKASPLPLPGEKEAAAVFRDGLTLKFRPQEEGGAPL